jgi:uncharacterized protein (TIGR03067 family)
MTPMLLAITLTIAAPGPKDAKADPPKIEGNWVLESYVLGGKEVDREKGVVFKFADGRLTVGTEPEMTYLLDPKADPPRVDLFAGKGKQKSILGIYKFKGETLVICFPHNGDAGRPTKFESPDGTNIVLLTLNREKKKD